MKRSRTLSILLAAAVFMSCVSCARSSRHPGAEPSSRRSGNSDSGTAEEEESGSGGIAGFNRPAPLAMPNSHEGNTEGAISLYDYIPGKDYEDWSLSGNRAVSGNGGSLSGDKVTMTQEGSTNWLSFSDGVSENGSSRKKKTSENAAFSDSDGDDSVSGSGSTIQNERFSVQVKKADRSGTYEGEGKKIRYTFSYERALLPDSVENHEKINDYIEKKARDFFDNSEKSPVEYLEENGGKVPSGERLIRSASIEDIYLDSRYYSVNLAAYTKLGAAESIDYIGYTFDLSKGERVYLPKVLNMDGAAVKDLAWNRMQACGFPIGIGEEEFRGLNIEKLRFCIAGNGSVCLLSSKNELADGAAGALGIALQGLSGIEEGSLGYHKDSQYFRDARYSFDVSAMDLYAKSLGLPGINGILPLQYAAQLKNGTWLVPLSFQDLSGKVLAEAWSDPATGSISKR